MKSIKILSYNNRIAKRALMVSRVVYNVKVGALMFPLLLLTSRALAQNVTIPDANFKSALVADAAINTNGDAEIQVSEALAVTGTLDVRSEDISDLSGIEAFVNITGLNCSSNQLTDLNVSSNTALVTLQCYSNQLTELTTIDNQNLTTLNCSNNQLITLDVSNNTSLETLSCDKNKLTSLELKGAAALTYFYSHSNQLTNVDLSENTLLQELNLYDNKLTHLDVSANTALTSLGCGKNQLTSLDIGANPDLVDLECEENQLTNIDVSTNLALEVLYCAKNQLTALDLSKNILLEELNCSNTSEEEERDSKKISIFNSRSSSQKQVNAGNRIASLDLRANVALTDLKCSDNLLTHLDLRNGNNIGLRTAEIENNLLTCIVVDDPTNSWKWNRDTGTTFCSDIPTTTVISYPLATTNQSPFLVTVNFEKEVTGFELTDLVVTNGVAGNLQTADNITFTIDITPATEGDVTLNMDSHKVEDLAGDPNMPASEISVRYDKTSPTATFATANTTQLPIQVLVLFDEVVSGFELTDLGLTNCTADNLKSTDNQTFTMEVTPQSSGVVTIDLEASKVVDLAGNPNIVVPQFSIRYQAILGWSDNDQHEVSLYPNPVVSGLFVDINNHQWNIKSSGQIALSDIWGKQILVQNINFNQMNPTFIDMHTYPSGLYLLQINVDDISVIKKIMKD